MKQRYRIGMLANAAADLIAIAVLSACSAPSQSESGYYHSVGQQGWQYGDSVIFTPDTLSAPADIAVAIRHTNNYEYSSIWVELTTTECLDDSTIERVDTFNIILADQFGRWRGTGIGVGFQFVDTLKHNVILKPGSDIILRHVMRNDTLPNIEQAGIIVVSNQ